MVYRFLVDRILAVCLRYLTPAFRRFIFISFFLSSSFDLPDLLSKPHF